VKICINIATAVFAALLLVCLVSCGEVTKEPEETVDLTIPHKLTYVVNNRFAGRINGETEQILTGAELSSRVTAVEKDGYIFKGWSDGSTDFKRENDTITSDTTITAIFDYNVKNCPVIDIVTDDGRNIEDKREYVGASLSVAHSDGGEYDLSPLAIKIRGRGNATWNMEKKSYRIKLSRRRNLLGIGEGPAKDWVLLANHCDQSLVRNIAAFDLGRRLPGIECSSGSALVNLYFNGRYQGVYHLCEQSQVDKYRVDVGDDGWMVELDMYADGVQDLDWFSSGNRPYSVTYGGGSIDRVTEIHDYIRSCTNAIKSGEKSEIEKLIDIDSCIDMYLLHEYAKNIDVGWSSFFMYYRNGKLYFGPPWDFDLAFGNDHRLDNGSYEGIYVGENRGFDQGNRWFIMLFSNDWFKLMAAKRFFEVKPIIEDEIEYITELSTNCRYDLAKNFQLWQIFGQRINQEPEHIMALSKQQDHAAYLIEWMKARLSWLDGYFNQVLKTQQ